MALIGIEGWDHYRNGDPSPFDNGAVPSSVQTGANTPFNYGQASTSTNSTTYNWAVNNRPTVIQGVRFYRATIGTTTDGFVVMDGATVQVHLIVDTTNRKVLAYRGSGTTNLLGESAANSLPPIENWFHLEWKVTIDPSAGVVEVRLDGNVTPILNLTGQNTRASANSRITEARVGSSIMRTDDYHLFDDTGSVNNDFAGNVRVYTEFPTSDDSVQFTPLSGTDNYAMVDDPGDVDADTTYNSTLTAGHKDTFGVTGDVPVTATVYAFESRAVMRKDEANVCTGRIILKSGGTQANGTTQTFGTSYAQYRQPYDVDPTDSAAWTPAKVNAIKIGYERVT